MKKLLLIVVAAGAALFGPGLRADNYPSKSITLVATGQFHAQLKRDGTGFILVTGHGPSIPHPITGEPGIWYLSGRLIARFDAAGNPTSLHSTGKLVNICTQLAA